MQNMVHLTVALDRGLSKREAFLISVDSFTVDISQAQIANTIFLLRSIF